MNVTWDASLKTPMTLTSHTYSGDQQRASLWMNVLPPADHRDLITQVTTPKNTTIFTLKPPLYNLILIQSFVYKWTIIYVT